MLKFILNLFSKKTFASITADLKRMVDELENHAAVQTQIALDADAAAAAARAEFGKARAAASKLKDLLG